MTDALRGMVKKVSLRARARDGAHVLFDLDVSPVGDGASKSLLLVASRVSLSTEHAEPPESVCYKVRCDDAQFGALEFITTGTQTHYFGDEDERCFHHLYGLEEPCRDCPVLRSGEPWPRAAVRAHATRDGSYEIATARLAEKSAAEVHVQRISDEDLGRLVSAKLRRIAESSNLTSRELAVLEHLMVGRGPDEIATLLSVSKRTVKFHQTNILQKLGAESRNDILRLIF